jgi:hypothetical protein
MKPARISSVRELRDLIMTIGFIPLFDNEIGGFSVMECTGRRHWWTGDEERDPWIWRMILSEDPHIAYGKLFRNRAGFISRKWLPYLASFRRDGYDFDARYEDGKASFKCKKIMDLFEKRKTIPSYLIRSMAGFSGRGEKGFEGAITLLQMQTYLTTWGFTRKQSKSGEYYGWHIGVFSLTEEKFGRELVTGAYAMGPEGAREKLMRRMMKINPEIDHDAAENFLR